MANNIKQAVVPVNQSHDALHACQLQGWATCAAQRQPRGIPIFTYFTIYTSLLDGCNSTWNIKSGKSDSNDVSSKLYIEKSLKSTYHTE